MNGWRLGIRHSPFNLAMRDARKAKGWSLQALAAATGLHWQTLGGFERLTHWPSERSADAIAMALGVPADVLFPEDVGEAVRGHPARAVQTSLDFDAVRLGGGGALGLATGDPAEGYDDRQPLAEVITDVLDQLSGRERRVVQLRYGLNGDEPMTLQAIAEEFHVTRDRIRQIEGKAMRRLRHPALSRGLVDYVNDPSACRHPGE